MTNPLQDALAALNRAKETIAVRRNEEDRRFITANIGKDLVNILTPLLQEISASSRLNKADLKEIMQKVKVELPKFEIPKIEIERQEIPPIEFPTQELIRAFRIAIAGIKFPKTEVNVPEMPKEIKVRQITELISEVKKLADAKMVVDWSGKFAKDNPLPVILTDEDGKFYKAISQFMTSGGGGGVVEIRKIHGATGLTGGTTTITTAGTPERITTTTTPIRRVWIQALDTNTGVVAIGGMNVDETPATRKGLAIFATQGQWFEVSDLSIIWLDVSVGGEGVNYLYET